MIVKPGIWSILIFCIAIGPSVILLTSLIVFGSIARKKPQSLKITAVVIVLFVTLLLSSFWIGVVLVFGNNLPDKANLWIVFEKDNNFYREKYILYKTAKIILAGHPVITADAKKGDTVVNFSKRNLYVKVIHYLTNPSFRAKDFDEEPVLIVPGTIGYTRNLLYFGFDKESPPNSLTTSLSGFKPARAWVYWENNAPGP